MFSVFDDWINDFSCSIGAEFRLERLMNIPAGIDDLLD